MSTSAKSGGGNGRRRGRSATASRRKRSSGDQAARVEQLVHALETGIATGSIPVNSWLRQETLAAEFSVSRTPVREALRVLQVKGMVELVPNRGALVRGPSSRDIREAYVLRAELEGFAAQLAADYIRDDELRQLREAEELFGRTVDTFISGPQEDAADAGARPTWMQANDLFHQAVQLGAGNSRLKAAIEDLHRSFPRNLTWSALSGDSRLLSDNVKEHAAIRAAIEERDAAAARRLMTDHVLRSGELVVMWFERQADQR
jgi:DNA-binding GntR family transcriptional regulator